MKKRNKEVPIVDVAIAKAKTNSKTIKKTLFLLAIFLLISIALNTPVLAQTQGCYTFPGGSKDLFCEDNINEDDAMVDCELYDDCDNFDDYFFAGQLCSSSTFDEICGEVICSTDCDTQPIGKCEYDGGQEVIDEEYDLWCSEGCCSVGSFCSYVDLRYDCQERAEQQGYTIGDAVFITEDITPSSCQSDICGVEQEIATLTGYVLDEEGVAITNAQLDLTTTLSETSASDGSYTFSDVTPGSYVMQVSATGYMPDSSSVTLSSGEQEELNFTLQVADATGNIYGYVEDLDGNSVEDVTICYDGADSGCDASDEDGFYNFTNLYEGDYTFTLSRYGYATTEVDITIEGDLEDYTLTIESVEFQGITGITYLDENDDSLADDEAYGVGIYVDGTYKGSSDYPNSDYSIQLDSGTYTIYASYQDYESQEYEVTISDGETYELDLILSKYVGECSYGQENDQKAVEELFASTVTGQLEVELEWDKPCPEVSGYLLYRDGELVEQSLSPLAVSYQDDNVEWGETYEYEIWAVYTDGPIENETGEPQVRLSESGASVSITLGDAECEGIEQGQFFCKSDDDSTTENERKYIYTCDSSNNLVTTTDCSALDDSDNDYFCTQVSSDYAVCKNAGACNVVSQLADPFGIYYNSETCYGEESSDTGFENFCYYDYSTSVSNTCESCEQVESCFDYLSQDSCEVNNCLGVGCEWVIASTLEEETLLDTEFLESGYAYPVTQETGHGYCIETDYEEDDQCYLCGPDADLFENNYCTPDICTDLGSCFSEEDYTACNECGDQPSSDANCFEYESELECTGGQEIENNLGEITLSDDQCGWGRCLWVDSDSEDDLGYCVKDGDGDGSDDCSEFSAGEYSSCELDHTPPETSVSTTSFAIISTAFTNLTFVGVDDANPMGELWYCLASSDASDCTDFEVVEYDGLLSEEELVVNVIDSDFLQSSVISGETYKLRFFSKDKYYNQESVQETYVFVDNELPDFTIESSYTTDADVTDLIVYLGDQNEPMECDFIIEKVLPEGDSDVVSFERDDDKEYEYTNLEGVIYNFTASCVDDHGNAYNESVEYAFDLEQDITLIYPEYDSAVDETSIVFEIETAVSASCELYYDESGNGVYEKITDFIATDDDQKVHETEEISGFFEGDYSGNVKVVCVESLTDEFLEDYFYFVVDFTAPETQIILTEDSRVEEPTGYSWEEYFIEEVVVTFDCDADGFECDQTFYCLGDGCEYASASGYEQFDGEFSVTNTTKICYYSTDIGGSKAFPVCGEIIVEGFGIKLINPDAYTYEDEIWGVSNTPTFDWEVMSKVDTESCKFDFTEGFDYDSQPSYKTFEESDTADNYYLFEGFPGEVLTAYDDDGSSKILYVQCLDYEGEVGPSEKMNLEYDPTAPEIESLGADPGEITEGINTNLYASTDDKTLCKYSDNSEGDGSIEYETMEYEFDGYDDNILYTDHASEFSFSFEGATKDYYLNVQCMNGAGDFSDVEELTFSVDYSAEGYIVSTSPDGYTNETTVTLEVVTSKNAQCVLDSDTTFNTTGSTTHTHVVSGLSEGEYQYLVTCQISENLRDGEINFVVDQTAPTVTSVDDGTYSCSLEEVNFLAYTDEDNISTYYYELYQGEPSGLSSTLSEYLDSGDDTTTSVLIAEGSLPTDNGTSITGLELEENETYYLQVYAQDAAGNWGTYSESDGFLATDSNLTDCAADDEAPSVQLTTNQSCTATTAELYCDDELSCDTILYGESSSSSNCEADSVYYGSKISFDSSGWLCYYVEDVNGNNKTGSKKVDFDDDDSDSIANDCDICSSTSAGKSVDSDGCSYGQTPDDEETNDEDGDGLPDYWEKLFDQTGCDLSYASEDTNEDGVTDTDEDYDDDGLTNYEEYHGGNDPCLADNDETETTVEVTTTNTSAEETTTTTTGFDVVAFISTLLGFLILGGSIGYLIYFYYYTPAGKEIIANFLKSIGRGGAAAPGVSPGSRPRSGLPPGYPGTTKPSVGVSRPASVGATTVPQTGFIGNIKQKIANLKKARLKRTKELQRQKVFQGFSTGSRELPHFKDLIRSKREPHKKFKQLVERYQQHKETIRPGLRVEEKSLFDRLDQISKKTPASGSKPIVTKTEANDIFKKLKKMSKQRKQR